MNKKKANEFEKTAEKLISLGCDSTEAIIAARAMRSLRPEGFHSDKEMQAINNCAAKVIESIVGKRHESFH